MIKIIEPSVVEITEQDYAKRIELAGRSCWQSEDKINETSADKFVNRLIKLGHTSPLEHSNIVVETLTDNSTIHMHEILSEYECKTGLPHYIRSYTTDCDDVNAWCDNIWSGSVRAWRSIASRYKGEDVLYSLFGKNKFFSDIKWNVYDGECDDDLDDYSKARIIPKDPLNRPRHDIVTVKIECSRAIANEWVRHRLFGITQASTRYINYSECLPITRPWWAADEPERFKEFCDCMNTYQEFYASAMSKWNDATPQMCRAILPNETATTLYLTGTVEYWDKYVLPLRIHSSAHPDIRDLAHKITGIIFDHLTA